MDEWFGMRKGEKPMVGLVREEEAFLLMPDGTEGVRPALSPDGRCAAFEVMLAVPAIRNLIRENKTYQIQSTIQTNKEIGMQTLDDSIYELYVNGRISRLEAMRNCVEYTAMEKKIMGGR